MSPINKVSLNQHGQKAGSGWIATHTDRSVGGASPTRRRPATVMALDNQTLLLHDCFVTFFRRPVFDAW